MGLLLTSTTMVFTPVARTASTRATCWPWSSRVPVERHSPMNSPQSPTTITATSADSNWTASAMRSVERSVMPAALGIDHLAGSAFQAVADSDHGFVAVGLVLDGRPLPRDQSPSWARWSSALGPMTAGSSRACPWPWPVGAGSFLFSKRTADLRAISGRSGGVLEPTCFRT